MTIIKKILLAMSTLFVNISHCQLIYYPSGQSHNPHRKISYQANEDDFNVTNNDTGLWTQVYAPRIPGEPLFLLSGSALAGVVHQSDLQNQHMCATAHTWNYISGDSWFSQDAETTVLIPFTVNQPTTLKINFTGHWNLFNHINNQQLFVPLDFQLKEGLSGSGSTLISFSGGGSEYVDLPTGDYRLTTGINNNLTCSPFPCHNEVAGLFRFDVDVIDDSSQPGSSAIKPFLPDVITQNQDTDHQYVDTNGAVTFQANSLMKTFNQKTAGWFELEVQHNNILEPANGSIIHTLELPPNRAGTFHIAVGDVQLGQFSASDVLIFEDFTAELGMLLISGNNNTSGVATVTVSYRPSLGENIGNGCGFDDRLSVYLGFDETFVDLNSTSYYLPDPLFTSRFE
ncbi:MAG: hypothetical protein R3E90_01330 [Marinicella sp.]|nr:hypothetical protein [Xanthomonadales bacterium]